MKNLSQDFIDKEEATQRKPVELYHIWRDGGEHWRYTSGDIPVTFNGDVYSPAALSRGSVAYNSKLDSRTVQINIDYVQDATIKYLAINPVEVMWVSIMKLHRDQTPLEADIVFLGQIKSVPFKGVKGVINCVSFEFFLKMTIPKWRYHINCNHQVFDSLCGLTKLSYKTTTQITLDATKLIMTSSAFGAKADGFFIGGEVVFGDEARTVVAHSGDDVTLMYPFITLETLDTVDAYPGCDGRIETCYTKYDNIDSFLGFPFIPVENPATRVSW